MSISCPHFKSSVLGGALWRGRVFKLRSWQLYLAKSRKNLRAVSLIGLLAATAVFPIAGVITRSNAASPPVTITCDEYLVRSTELFAHPGLATVSKDGHVVQIIRNWSIESVECRYVTNNLVPDLVIDESTGDWHCCEIVEVFSLSPFRRVLSYAGGYSSGESIIRKDHLLVLNDGHFDYFEHLCHICSPDILPLVACYEKYEGFKDCTSKHPDIVSEYARFYTDRLRVIAHTDPRQNPDYTESTIRGMALGVYICYLMMGQEDRGLNAVRSAGGEEVLSWLARHRDLISQWLATRGDKLLKAPPASTN